MDLLTFIMAVEDDPRSLTIEEYVDGMAEMVRTNVWRNLQGSWQRAAYALMEGGIIDTEGNVLEYPVAS